MIELLMGACGLLATVVAGLLFKGKLDKNKIENLEEENIMYVKKDYIQDEMKKTIDEAEAIENEATKDINVSDWRNKLNKLHDNNKI